MRDIDFVDILYASGAKRNKDPHQLQIFGLPLACNVTKRLSARFS